MKTEVTDAASQMDHHPEVVSFKSGADEVFVGSGAYDRISTLSCTTHNPPGLGMRDVKLAHKIEEIIGRHPQATELDLECKVFMNSDDGPLTAKMKDVVIRSECAIRRLVSDRVKKSSSGS